MKCRKCGYEMDDTQQFCNMCGADQREYIENADTEESPKTEVKVFTRRQYIKYGLDDSIHKLMKSTTIVGWIVFGLNLITYSILYATGVLNIADLCFISALLLSILGVIFFKNRGCALVWMVNSVFSTVSTLIVSGRMIGWWIVISGIWAVYTTFVAGREYKDYKGYLNSKETGIPAKFKRRIPIVWLTVIFVVVTIIGSSAITIGMIKSGMIEVQENTENVFQRMEKDLNRRLGDVLPTPTPDYSSELIIQRPMMNYESTEATDEEYLKNGTYTNTWKVYAEGKVSGSEYESTYFNIGYAAPNDWKIATEQEIQMMNNTEFMEMVAFDSEFNEIDVLIEPEAGDVTFNAYLVAMHKAFTDIGLEATMLDETVTIAGKKFMHITANGLYQGIEFKRDVYARKDSNAILVIGVTTRGSDSSVKKGLTGFYSLE